MFEGGFAEYVGVGVLAEMISAESQKVKFFFSDLSIFYRNKVHSINVLISVDHACVSWVLFFGHSSIIVEKISGNLC